MLRLARDEVRLMVSFLSSNRVVHTRFRQIGSFLAPGDVVVINTSGTLQAALNATRSDGTPIESQNSTHLPAGLWSVELRQLSDIGTQPFYQATRGEMLQLRLLGPLSLYSRPTPPRDLWAPYGHTRLWLATLDLPYPLQDYLVEHGFPIRYGYVNQLWPIEYYQTVYTTEPGSAEMPSAGRPFTASLIAQLVARGVQFAPLLLHTGVASLQGHEPPYEEYYRVPLETAQLINAAHAAGRRVIAVGTTCVVPRLKQKSISLASFIPVKAGRGRSSRRNAPFDRSMGCSPACMSRTPPIWRCWRRWRFARICSSPMSGAAPALSVA